MVESDEKKDCKVYREGKWYPGVVNFNKGENLSNQKDDDVLQKRMDIDLRK